MMYYEYHPRSPLIVKKAKEKYPWLIGMSNESIEARYWLLEYLENEYGYNGILEKDESGKPRKLRMKNEGGKIDEYYWSLSHTEYYTAFSISHTHTGIDIVDNRERDISLLDTHSDHEYDLLGGKNWEHFFILWSGKEAIIKTYGNTLDDMRNIMCQKKVSESLLEYKYYDRIIGVQIWRDQGKNFTIAIL